MDENVFRSTRKTIEKFEFIEVLAINEDGNLISIMDEAWTFQFLPIVNKGGFG